MEHVHDPDRSDAKLIVSCDAHSVALDVEGHEGGVVDSDDRVPGTVDGHEVVGGRVGLAEVVDVPYETTDIW